MTVRTYSWTPKGVNKYDTKEQLEIALNEFEVWKIKAKEKLTAYRTVEISADEFKQWFMDDQWTKF